MDYGYCVRAMLVRITLALVIIMQALGAFALGDNPSALLGAWSEDCKIKYVTIITPQYYAIVNNIPNNSYSIGFGVIDRFTTKGKVIEINLSHYYSRDYDEKHPKYQVIDDNTLLYIRSKKFWEKSENAYHEFPKSRPRSYVDINQETYGVIYHRCTKDKKVIDETISQIIENNRE